jgi:mutator protein MutT
VPERARKFVVAALCVDEQGRVLLTKRRDDQPMGGKWELPGGKVEPGESPTAALAREIVEELGCACAVGAVYDVLFHAYDEFDLVMPVYACTLDGAPRPVEVAELAWVPPERLPTYDVLPADVALCERLAREHVVRSAPRPNTEATMVNGFVHTELSTDDPAAAKKFYKGLFDWKLEDVQMGPGMVYTTIKTGQPNVGGGIMKKMMAEAPTAWLAYVMVDDVTKSLAKAEKLGARVVVPKTPIPDMGAFGIFLDPTGAALGIYEAAPKRPAARKAAPKKKPAAKAKPKAKAKAKAKAKR